MSFRRNGVALAGAILAISIPEAAPAAGDRATLNGAEVLTGSIQCSGSVYTDEQDPSIQAIAYLSGTSDIVADFAPFPSERRDVPADLDEMERICVSFLESARAAAPPNCALKAVSLSRGVFGNGSSTHGSFSFVCEGRRDAVVRAVAAFSRAVVLADLH